MPKNCAFFVGGKRLSLMHFVCKKIGSDKKWMQYYQNLKVDWFSNFYNDEVHLKTNSMKKNSFHYIFNIEKLPEPEELFSICKQWKERAKLYIELIDFLLEKFTKEQALEFSQDDITGLSEVFLPILLSNSKYLKKFLNDTYFNPFLNVMHESSLPSYGQIPAKRN